MRRRRVWRRARSMHASTFSAVLIMLLAVAVLVVPLTGEAQQAASLPRIGFLGTSSLSDPRAARLVGAFRQGLRELGYVEGCSDRLYSGYEDSGIDPRRRVRRG
jgi:hypothetical protein